jgi:hypothetical protein
MLKEKFCQYAPSGRFTESEDDLKVGRSAKCLFAASKTPGKGILGDGRMAIRSSRLALDAFSTT